MSRHNQHRRPRHSQGDGNLHFIQKLVWRWLYVRVETMEIHAALLIIGLFGTSVALPVSENQTSMCFCFPWTSTEKILSLFMSAAQVQIGILASNSNEVKWFPYNTLVFAPNTFGICSRCSVFPGPETERIDSCSTWTSTGGILKALYVILGV